MPQQQYPGIGEDVSHLMGGGGSAVPAIGEDVSHLMDGSSSEQIDKPAAPSRSWLDSVGDLFGELTSLNPKKINEGIQQTFWHPLDTLNAAGNAQGELKTRAEDAFKRGDYAEGLAHSLYYLMPLIGPRLDQAGSMMQKGEFAKGLGATADVALQTMAPEVADNALGAIPRPTIKVPSVAPSPQMADALAFARREGIPLDAATATGSDLVKSIQKKVGDSMGGAGTAERFKTEQSNRLATIGEQLAAKANEAPLVGPLPPNAPRPTVPGPSVTSWQAGSQVQNGVRNVVHDQNAIASTHYNLLRNIEEQPRSAKKVTLALPDGDVEVSMGLPVDLRDTKSALTSIYSRLKDEGEIAPLMGQKAEAARALKRLVTGPDYAPLSVVDAALGDLKDFIRADNPDLRTTGQAAAVDAVNRLHANVMDTAKAAGPDVVHALNSGRKATQAKYVAADVLKGLETGQGESVGTFARLTANGDASIGQLRDVAKQAPEAIPSVARAVLDNLMDKATSEGGFQHALAVRAQWQKMHPQTKALLFPDSSHVSDIDSFFRLAAKMAENPNPSGTARINNLFNVASAAVGYPVSKLMYTPTGVKLLTEGLRLPPATAAANAWLARVKDAARSLQVTSLAGQTAATAPAK